jgi:hypothetical protein
MSSTPTISDYVELLVLIFCFFDTPVIDPHPSDIITPVCHLQSPYVAKGASTNYLMILRLSTRNISSIYSVPITYLSMYLEVAPIVLVWRPRRCCEKCDCHMYVLSRPGQGKHQLRHSMVKRLCPSLVKQLFVFIWSNLKHSVSCGCGGQPCNHFRKIPDYLFQVINHVHLHLSWCHKVKRHS